MQLTNLLLIMTVVFCLSTDVYNILVKRDLGALHLDMKKLSAWFDKVKVIPVIHP